MKLLVCGHGTDPVCNYLRQAWSACRKEIQFLDLDWSDVRYRFDCRSVGDEESGAIEAVDWRLNLEDISVVFLRFLGANHAIKSVTRYAVDREKLEYAHRY
jgi:hypothetical protein